MTAIFVKYLLNVIDSRQPEAWENRSMYMFYLELTTGWFFLSILLTNRLFQTSNLLGIFLHHPHLLRIAFAHHSRCLCHPSIICQETYVIYPISTSDCSYERTIPRCYGRGIRGYWRQNMHYLSRTNDLWRRSWKRKNSPEKIALRTYSSFPLFAKLA